MCSHLATLDEPCTSKLDNGGCQNLESLRSSNLEAFECPSLSESSASALSSSTSFAFQVPKVACFCKYDSIFDKSLHANTSRMLPQSISLRTANPGIRADLRFCSVNQSRVTSGALFQLLFWCSIEQPSIKWPPAKIAPPPLTLNSGPAAQWPSHRLQLNVLSDCKTSVGRACRLFQPELQIASDDLADLVRHTTQRSVPLITATLPKM